MDLVFNLLEKYPSKHEEVQEKQPTQEVKEVPTTHEEAQEALDNADTGSSLPEMARNLIIDIGVPAVAGSAGGAIASKIASKVPAQAAASKALELLKRGADDALGHQTSLIKKGTSKNSKVMKMMAQNEAAAKSVAEGGNGKKALRTILKNTKREAEIGPRFMDDIEMILQNDTGLSEKEVKKAIKDFMKENADNVELIKLIEAKDPLATYSHSLGVQDLAYKLAKKAGLTEEKARKIADAALVHDIGKVQVPDSIISTKADFRDKKYAHLKKWMLDHDVVGGEILKSDPYKAKIASEHHPSGRISGSNDVGLVTTADVYEAMTSKKRSYKPSLSPDEALTEINKKVNQGEVKEEHLDLLKELGKDRPDRYDYQSPLESPYKSMKANEIKKQVASDYATKFFMDKAKKSIPLGTAAGLGASAVMELVGNPYANIPSLSDILSLYSPTMKPKAEKLEDIKRWYNEGHYNDEIENLIVNTDFKDNKQVTKLWKLMRDQIKD